MPILHTIGHSVVPIDALLDAPHRQQIEALWDVRRYPSSRRHPQFNRDALARALANHGIEYRHVPALGGRREPDPASLNTALRDDGLRGFADYAATPAFTEALDELIEAASERRIVIMCAEADPAHCHRSLISDALLARDVPVVHIAGAATRPHAFTRYARVEGGRVSYPSLI